MKYALILISTMFTAIASAENAEDKNVVAFSKAFPNSKTLAASPDGNVHRFSVSSKLSVENVASKLSEALGIKLSILSAKDPKIFPSADTLSRKADAHLIMGIGFICLLVKDLETDEAYTASILKTIDSMVTPDLGHAPKQGGRDSNIDMRLPN